MADSRDAAVRATSVDVARLAGVSQSAVSRALTPGSSISAQARAKVLTAAAALDYVPNSIARSLITRRSNIVAVVIGDLRNPFYTAVLDELSQRVQALGKQVLVFNVPRGGDMDAALARGLEYQIDGVVITSAQVSTRMAGIYVQRGIPLVTFNRYVPGLAANSVCCDNLGGGGLAADTLGDSGGRRFGIIYGERDATTNIDRIQGFLDRLRQRGLDTAPIAQECGEYSYEGGFAAALRLLGGSEPPDALFALNDIMALGAIDAIRARLGLRIPEDVMIIGFDDIPEASRSAYQLTTIRQPVTHMIDETCSLLASRGTPVSVPSPVARFLPGRLMARSTVRPPPAS